MDAKIQAVLLDIGVGWVLSQITDYIRERGRRKNKIEASYTELADIDA